MKRITAESYAKLYDAAWKASADSREPVTGRLAEGLTGSISWTRAVDFHRPVRGHHDIKGLRFLSSADYTGMYVITHGGEAYPAAEYADEEMAAQFADAARQAAEYRRSHPRGKVWSPEGFASRACVRRFEEIDSGIYFYQFDDYSGGLVNALGQTLDTSISDYEFILDMRVLGKLNGITHYAVKCAYSSRTPVEYVIFSIKGNAVLLPGDGIRNADSLDRIYDEFQKLARKGPGSRDAVRAKAAERCRNSQANSISNKGIRR